MQRINVLWVIDHVCYDGNLHGGGRLYWNVLPRFNTDRFNVVPCMLRASETIRQVFTKSPVPVRVLDKGKFDLTTLWTFLRLIKEEKIHVMHLHCYSASTFGRFAGLITGVPTIIHDYDTEVYFPYPKYLGITDKALSWMTHGAVAASPMVHNFLIKKRKIDRSKIRMMFHAIPPDKYIPVDREKVIKAREILEIDESTRIVCTVTKLGPQRGNEYLMKAASEVLKVFPNVIFLVIYKVTLFHRLPNLKYVEVSRDDIENNVNKLRTLSKELRIAEKVRFIEWPDNINELMSACDFIVAPFLSERFSSVSLIEAMAMGKPLITTNIGEQREVVKNGVNGYLVSPGDVKDLADKILRLLTHTEELAKMSRQARIDSEQYSVDAYAQTLQQWYTELAEEQSRHSLKVKREK